MNTRIKNTLHLIVGILLSALIILLAYSTLFFGFAALSEKSPLGAMLGLLLVIWIFAPFMLLGCTLLVGWLMPQLDAWVFVLTGTLTTICLFSFSAALGSLSTLWLQLPLVGALTDYLFSSSLLVGFSFGLLVEFGLILALYRLLRHLET